MEGGNRKKSHLFFPLPSSHAPYLEKKEAGLRACMSVEKVAKAHTSVNRHRKFGLNPQYQPDCLIHQGKRSGVQPLVQPILSEQNLQKAPSTVNQFCRR